MRLSASNLTNNVSRHADDVHVNGVGIVDLADPIALVAYLASGGYVLLSCP